MVVIEPESFGSRTNQRCRNPTEGAEPTFDLADVVEQCASNLSARHGWATLGETSGDTDAVETILVAELHPERTLTGEQMIIGPAFIGDGGWSGRKRPEEPSCKMPRVGDNLAERAHRFSLARGCADRYTSKSRSWLTRVYTWVVEIDTWPSISCTTRRSAPWSRRCVAHECRST